MWRRFADLKVIFDADLKVSANVIQCDADLQIWKSYLMQIWKSVLMSFNVTLVYINKTYSIWAPVTSSVSHGSVLGHNYSSYILKYVMEIAKQIVSKISKFVDDF